MGQKAKPEAKGGAKPQASFKPKRARKVIRDDDEDSLVKALAHEPHDSSQELAEPSTPTPAATWVWLMDG